MQFIQEGVDSGEDEVGRQATDDEDMDNHQIHRSPSQDLFYMNNEQYQQMPPQFNMDKSHSLSVSNPIGGKNQESQSQLDKKGLPQHKNSTDSEFNNKGNRKLRPASKGKILAQENSHSGINLESSSKVLLGENGEPANIGVSGQNSEADNHSSRSMDEIEMAKRKKSNTKSAERTQGPHTNLIQ